MSTTPTELLETTAAAIEETIESAVAATTEAILTTDPTEAGLDFDSIKEMMDAFDPAELLPQMDSIFETLVPICRVAVMVGPLVLLVLGLAYLFLAPKEANHYFGYRCYFGMGSIYAWRFTQRLAGITLGALGLILTGVMLVITGSFAGMETMDMLWKAIRCLAWEAGLALFATLFINFTVMICYDSRGQFRATQRKYKKK